MADQAEVFGARSWLFAPGDSEKKMTKATEGPADIVLITETAEAMFHTGDYKGAPRVVALTWGAEDLADSIGASSNRNPDGSYSFTYELARSLCVLGAATAAVVAIETIQGDFRDLE